MPEPAGNDIPVTVDFRCDEAHEVWRRSFAGRDFFSTQEEGRGGFDRLLCERFGPAMFGLALVVKTGRLQFRLRRWSLFGFAVPIALAPKCEAYEYEDQGRFHFFVDIGLKWIGLVVRYQGWLELRAPHYERHLSNGLWAEQSDTPGVYAAVRKPPFRIDLGRRRDRDYRCRARGTDQSAAGACVIFYIWARSCLRRLERWSNDGALEG